MCVLFSNIYNINYSLCARYFESRCEMLHLIRITVAICRILPSFKLVWERPDISKLTCRNMKECNIVFIKLTFNLFCK